MNALSIPVVMMAGISFYVGFYHLSVYYRRARKHQVDLTFALTCLTMGMYQIFCIGMYNVTSVEEGVLWQRLQVGTLSLIGIAFAWFTMDYIGHHYKRIRTFLTLYFLISSVLIYFNQSSLTFCLDKPQIKHIAIPYLNINVTYYEVASGPVVDLSALMGALYLLFIVIVSIRLCRRQKASHIKPLCISLFIFMGGLLNDIAVLSGVYDFIYMIEYAYIAIVILMAYTLSNMVVESAEIKEALIREQYLMKSLMDATTDHIYFKDKASRFLRINQTMAERFGLKHSDKAIGKTDFDFFSEEHAKQAFDDEQRILRTGEPLVNIEEKETWPNRETTWVSSTKMPLFGENNEIIGTFGISRDITSRKKADDILKKARANLNKKAWELERSNEALLKSNEDLEQFAYVVSHDLQEPLRMISSYVGLLEKRLINKLDADAKEFMSYVVQGATRMQSLIRDLLKYSRINTQTKPFEKTDLNVVMNRVLSNLSLQIKETGTDIKFDSLPTVMCDSQQIERLFQNLISNAIKYCKNKPDIYISSEKKDADWIISIKDNGIGIDTEFKERIFGIFQRLHKRSEYSGTGIGLAICKKIVEMHGGTIGVDSESGKGSTFHFVLSGEDSIDDF